MPKRTNLYCIDCGTLKTHENTYVCRKTYHTKAGYCVEKEYFQRFCKKCDKKRQQSNDSKAYRADYYLKNKDRITLYNQTHWKKYYILRKEKFEYRLRKKMSRSIKDRFKNYNITKADNFDRNLGCTISFFINYMESKFLPGMSWDNYGFYTWHIDHILPLASFDLSDPRQQKICFHYTNLQPLWAEDNLRKGDSLNYNPNSSAP